MAQLHSPSAWATLRFRRAKDVRGWALLGIPSPLYPQIMQRLFEQQARFIEKHHQTFPQGEFINILFEAPASLAAALALAFPAPSEAEALSVNEAGDRLLHGKAAQSAKAQHQAIAQGPGLAVLAEQIGFWQAVEAMTQTQLVLGQDPDLANCPETHPKEIHLQETHPKETHPKETYPKETYLEGAEPLEEEAEPSEESEGWENDEGWEEDKTWGEDQATEVAPPECSSASADTFEDIWVEEDSDWQEESQVSETVQKASETVQEEIGETYYGNHPVMPTPVTQVLGGMTIEQAMVSGTPTVAKPPDVIKRSESGSESVLRGDAGQIEILKQGAAVWNLWRDRHLDIRPSFRGAYLNHLDLRGADLRDADLRFAFLFHTDLSGADLRGASLLGADLIHANLQDADLREAFLSGAYLTHANLTQANLAGADLRGTFLYGAIFHRTVMPNGEWA